MKYKSFKDKIKKFFIGDSKSIKESINIIKLQRIQIKLLKEQNKLIRKYTKMERYAEKLTIDKKETLNQIMLIEYQIKIGKEKLNET